MATPPQFDFQKMAKNLPFTKNTKAAREWFRDLAMGVKKASVPKFQQTAKPFQKFAYQDDLHTSAENMPIAIGKMYFFTYDPKWKLTLPYYDTYPLVFPICYKAGSANDGSPPGMLGLNMHYLPPGLRARFMDNLYTIINNDKYNNTTKLNLSYEVLASTARLKYFEPCIHHYLFGHVRSPFQYIRPEQWDYTLMLPLARFQKKSQDYVWLNSSIKVR